MQHAPISICQNIEDMLDIKKRGKRKKEKRKRHGYPLRVFLTRTNNFNTALACHLCSGYMRSERQKSAPQSSNLLNARPRYCQLAVGVGADCSGGALMLVGETS